MLGLNFSKSNLSYKEMFKRNKLRAIPKIMENNASCISTNLISEELEYMIDNYYIKANEHPEQLSFFVKKEDIPLVVNIYELVTKNLLALGFIDINKLPKYRGSQMLTYIMTEKGRSYFEK